MRHNSLPTSSGVWRPVHHSQLKGQFTLKSIIHASSHKKHCVAWAAELWRYRPQRCLPSGEYNGVRWRQNIAFFFFFLNSFQKAWTAYSQYSTDFIVSSFMLELYSLCITALKEVCIYWWTRGPQEGLWLSWITRVWCSRDETLLLNISNRFCWCSEHHKPSAIYFHYT